MIPTFTTLAFVLAGDRVIVAVLQRHRVDTFIVEAEQPAAALRAELDARKLSPRGVAIGLPRGSVTVKPIELPAVGGTVRDMVRFELERHLPFATDDAAFDFVPLPAEREAKPAAAPAGQRVLIAAADRRVVEAALRIADEARLRPTSVTVAAHDLLSLVSLDRKQRIVWAHRMGSAIDLLFVDRGRLVMSRTVPAGDETAAAGEIGRSIAMLRWRGCDAIWLSGDAEAPGTPSATALTALGAPVTEPPYTARARRFLAADGLQAPRGASELAIAVAAGRKVRELDLIPEARRPRRVTRGQLATMGALTLTIALGLGALLYPGYRTTRYLDRVNASINRLTPEVRAVERVQQELERKRRLLATIQSIESNSVRPLPVLREITDLVPADAWITNISLDAKGVELTGQAAAASALIPILENSQRLERVEFASPVTRGRDKEQFRIRAAWEPPGARVAAAAPGAPGAARKPAPGEAASPAAPTAAPPSRMRPPTIPPPEVEPGEGAPRRPGATGRAPNGTGR